MEREYDERELQLLAKCKSQTLTFVFVEVIVAVFLYLMFPSIFLNDAYVIGLLFGLPIVFYRCKLSYYLETSGADYMGVIIGTIGLTVMFTQTADKTFFSYCVLALIWLCLILVTIFKRKNK